jgi:hypothetical protein
MTTKTINRLTSVRAHQRYKMEDGTIVPGVTTVVGILNKPALVPWANKLGLEGIDVSKYVDKTAVIGTCAHYLVQCHLAGEEPDLSDYSAQEISLAENALLKYWEWEKQFKITPILLETQLVSEKRDLAALWIVTPSLTVHDGSLILRPGKVCMMNISSNYRLIKNSWKITAIKLMERLF